MPTDNSWNDSARPQISCVGAIRANVLRHPRDCAVQSPAGEEVSYQELWQRSGWLAATLIHAGIGRGDVVAVAVDRSAAFFVAVLGIVRTGAAYLPLDPAAPAARHQVIIAEAQARIVVCVDPAAWSLPGGAVVVSLPQADPGRPVPDLEPAADDPMYVCYTSGSTGTPKGAIITHRAVASFTDHPRYCSVEPGDRVANVANPAFDATTFEVWNTLVAGATAVVFPAVAELPLRRWRGELRDRRVTTLFLTTALFHAIAGEDPAAFASLHTLLVGGEAIDAGAVASVCAAEPPRRLLNVYGPTEATTFATFFVCTAAAVAGRERVPIGGPVQETVLHVLEAGLTPVATGARGELCIGGPQIAAGYLGRPELTAERFVTMAGGERVYRTGDVVRQLPDGDLEFVGRADRQIKLRGFRVELEEIEHALVDTGAVSVARVEKVGEQLVGFVHITGDTDPAELGVLVARRLPSYMVPSRWVRIHRMPLTSNGKVDVAALLALLHEPDQADPDQAGPVRGLLIELLGTPHVRPGDNFLELGGSSIVALQAAARLQTSLGVAVNPAELLFSDTVADIESHVRDLMGGRQ